MDIDKTKLAVFLSSKSFKELMKMHETLKAIKKFALEEKDEQKLQTVAILTELVSSAMLSKFR